MQRSSIVTDYLDALTRELGFDVPLARRVRKEVEDHLWEAAADDPSGDPIEAQRRAIAKFGEPREIARRYAASSLFRQTRRVGATAVLALTGIFVAMKGRGAWYGLMQWALSDHLKIVGTIALAIDRYAFMFALVAGILGLAYIGSRRLPTEFHQAHRAQVKRCVMLCAATAGALLASVVTDTILTALRLFETKPSASALVPILSMAAEIAFAGVLVLQIRATVRRTAFVSSLLP